VFKNPPHAVAQIFKELCDKYKYQFKKISFAILERKEYLNEIFKTVFEN